MTRVERKNAKDGKELWLSSTFTNHSSQLFQSSWRLSRRPTRHASWIR